MAAHQPDYRDVVGKDAHYVGATFDLLIQPLELVGALDFAPVLVREMQERQHVFLSGIHHRHGAGELLVQHRRDLLPVSSHLLIPMEKPSPVKLDLESCLGSASGSAARRSLGASA